MVNRLKVTTSGGAMGVVRCRVAALERAAALRTAVKHGSTEGRKQTQKVRRGAKHRGKHGTEPKTQSTTRNQRVGERQS